MAHYGQTVSAEWLLLTGYRHLPMPYLMTPLPTLPFTPNRGNDPSPNTCIANCSQATADSDMVTNLLLTAYRNLPTKYTTVLWPTSYRHLFSQNKGPCPPNCIFPASTVGYPSNSWASCTFSHTTKRIAININNKNEQA